MKLIDLVNARDSLQKLIAQDLPLRTAYGLMRLTDECNRHLYFYGNELAKFDPQKEPGRLAELDNLEITLNAERITISLNGDLRLSATDCRLLMPVISFLEEE